MRYAVQLRKAEDDGYLIAKSFEVGLLCASRSKKREAPRLMKLMMLLSVAWCPGYGGIVSEETGETEALSSFPAGSYCLFTLLSSSTILSWVYAYVYISYIHSDMRKAAGTP